ncbi:MAG: hypothetical protein V2I33_25815 [Kangiellaceae bacterium]|jgi:hypothetical protein|nr:hypothetical protein [Kangiellaceae bacterium]
MNRFTATVFIALVSLSFFSGCREEKEVENMSVPRLMLESRRVDYGNLGGETLVLPVSGTTLHVSDEPLVDEFEIVDVDMVKVEMGLAVMVEVTDKGARDMYRKSVTNMGGRIVLTVNGNAVGAQRITRAIDDGKFYTFVEVDDEELGQLVLDIKESLFYLHSERASLLGK